MKGYLPRITPLLMVGGLLLPQVAAAAPGVRDQANFFNPAAVREADMGIQEIHRRFGKDLMIETFPAIPAGLKEKYEELGQATFFQDWARSRARDLQVNGIYVLICREPGRVQTEIGNETARQAFTPSNRQELTNILLTHFRDKNYDQGLLQAVAYVEKTMAANLGRGAESPATLFGGGDGGGGRSLFGWLCLGLLVLLGVWLVVGLFRTLTGMGRPSYPAAGAAGAAGPGYAGGGYAPGYGGGGSFMTGLMGGLFGAAAGSWLYDSFFRGGSSMTSPTEAGNLTGDTGGGVVDAGTTDSQPRDTDYTGTGGNFTAGNTTGLGGGSFDDTGGGTFDSGGDWGGGDLGGGDF
ncbi:MAG: TPM domain-containing protein [Gemmataceae bacterium]